MRPIEVDDHVFEALGKRARPFLDTPNDVLRRLLQLDPEIEEPSKGSSETPPNTSDALSQSPSAMQSTSPSSVKSKTGSSPPPLSEIFKYLKGDFRSVRPYRLMFQDGRRLLYVQNFGKPTNHLWYRITDKPWKELRTHQGDAWLCLSYPDGDFFYLIPIKEVIQMVKQRNWTREYLEINIDPSTSRWIEMGASLIPFKHRIG